jgi:hypothetical protein
MLSVVGCWLSTVVGDLSRWIGISTSFRKSVPMDQDLHFIPIIGESCVSFTVTQNCLIILKYGCKLLTLTLKDYRYETRNTRKGNQGNPE